MTGVAEELALRPRAGRVRGRAARAAHATLAVLTTLAGVLGILAMLVALAPLAGFQVVRLTTGSMSPTYPAGSLLLTRTVEASSVAVGDVVTLDRGDSAPITHRVVAVTTVADGVELRLRGDANRAEDPEPYRVSAAGLVVAGLPWGGQAVVALGSPAGVLALSGAVSLLVLWAWWPRGRRSDEPAGAPG